jgi:alpha-1,2-mannosyltransferase
MVSWAGLAQGAQAITQFGGPVFAPACILAIYLFPLLLSIWRKGAPVFDFLAFWLAARFALEGRAADAYAVDVQVAAQLRLHSDILQPVDFAYPPSFLLAIIPFGLMPYSMSAVVWVASTLCAWLAALRTLVPSRGMFVALAAFPAAYWNISYGQNGFVTAALFALAVRFLGPRPWVAGLCIGLLAYKPHLGVIIPLVLAAGGHWRAFLGATLTVIATSAAATLAFGPDIWAAFLGMTGEATSRLSQDPRYLRQMISIYAAVRLLGASETLALIVQVAVALPCLAVLLLLIRRRACATAQGAAMVCCAALCTPYLLRYDMVVIAIPLAWLWVQASRTGYLRGETAILVAAYLAALKATMAIGSIEVLFAPVAILALFVAIARRILHSDAARAGSDGLAPLPAAGTPG